MVNGHTHTVPWVNNVDEYHSAHRLADRRRYLGGDVELAFYNVDLVLVNVPNGVPVLPGSNNAYPD